MQCTMQAGSFLQALRTTKKALNSSYAVTTAPFVQLRVRDGRVKLIAYTADLQVAVDLTEGATIQQEGEVALWHEQLLKSVEAYQGCVCLRYEEGENERKSTALLSSDAETLRIPLRHESSRKLPAFPAPYAAGATYTQKSQERVMCEACHTAHYEVKTSTYAVVKTETQQVHITQAVLQALRQRVQWGAVSDNYSRGAYTGISIEVAQNQFSLLAADAFNVAVGSYAIKDIESWKHPVLVSAKWLNQAVKALPKKADVLVEATLAFHQLVKENDREVNEAPLVARASEVRMVAGNVEITLLPMHEKLPPYHSVIPEQPGPTRVLLSRAELLNALKSVAPIADYTGRSVWLHIAPTTRIEVKQQPESALCKVPVLEREGQEISLPFQCQRLLAPLQAMRSPQVALELTEPTQPLVLRSCADKEESLAVIMPTKG